LLCGLVTGITIASAGHAASKPAKARAATDPTNEPDRFAWELFAQVNKPSAITRLAVWETWASNEDLFVSDPNPAKPPVWPTPSSAAPKTLRKPIIPELLRQLRATGKRSALVAPRVEFVPGNPTGEEVRRNKDAFDFIVSNKLWYQEGIRAAINGPKRLDFPVPAVEIKAEWSLLPPGADKSRYHWNEVGGKVYVLTAMHISSKALPDWFWATFEHVDIPERPKPLDSFGITPANDLKGKPSTALQALLKQAGLGSEWLNYRLDGAQAQFTNPVTLWNSRIEGAGAGLKPDQSSCLTCHGLAAAKQAGTGVSFNFNNAFSPPKTGPINPAWLTGFTQLDFVWSFDNAAPATKK
jgi:hypothetical protein